MDKINHSVAEYITFITIVALVFLSLQYATAERGISITGSVVQDRDGISVAQSNTQCGIFDATDYLSYLENADSQEVLFAGCGGLI